MRGLSVYLKSFFFVLCPTRGTLNFLMKEMISLYVADFLLKVYVLFSYGDAKISGMKTVTDSRGIWRDQKITVIKVVDVVL